MQDSVSVCLLTRDELPFLKLWLPRVREFADEVLVMDTGSTDGSWEFIKSELRGPNERACAIKNDQLEHQGFGATRRLLCAGAQCDWVWTLDADEMPGADQRHEVKKVLASSPSSVVSIHTWTYPGSALTDWDAINKMVVPTKESHRRIYRNGCSFEWKGFIHEELYWRETNAYGMAWQSPIIHHHYTNYRVWQDSSIKQKRYARMLLAAADDPEKQKYVNGWWFKTYVLDKFTVS